MGGDVYSCIDNVDKGVDTRVYGVQREGEPLSRSSRLEWCDVLGHSPCVCVVNVSSCFFATERVMQDPEGREFVMRGSEEFVDA